MNAMAHRKLTLAAALAAAMLAAWTTGAPAEAPLPAEPGPAEALEPAGAPPADALPAEGEEADELALVLQTLSPEELQELVNAAVKLLLQNERDLVAAEMRANLLYDPAEVKKAVEQLNREPADTLQDNMGRIMRALAAVDVRFGKAYRLFAESKYTDAADAAKGILNPQQTTFSAAARYYLYAEALVKCSRGEEAVDAYSEIWERMRDRTSFAANSVLKTAQTWEALRRGYYAMKAYGLYRSRYQLILDEKERAGLDEKIAQLTTVYRRPLDTAAGWMGDSGQLLASSDSGPLTQKKQDQIIALLDDLIQTAEESGGAGGSSSSGSKSKQPPKGSGGQSGKTPMLAGGVSTGNPGSGAQESTLRGGPNVRPTGGAEVRGGSESGDWSKLPPRERQRLEEIKRKVMSERYQDIIADYHKRLAGQLSE